MNAAHSTLHAARVATVPGLTGEERGRELERLALAQVSHPGLLSELAAGIVVSALASDRLQGSALDEAWLEYLAALRLCQGELDGLAALRDAAEADLAEALAVLLDGSRPA
jgi:hypothetical protein